MGHEDGDELGEDDDEEDAAEGDEAPGSLEVGVIVASGFVDDAGFDVEGLHGEHVLLFFGLEDGSEDSEEGGEEGGAEEGDEFSW